MDAGVEWSGSPLYLETLRTEEARENIFGYKLSAQNHINIFLTSEILHLKEPATLTAPFQTSTSILRSWQHVGPQGASDSRMINEWWNGKDLEGTSCGLTELLARNFPPGDEENKEKLYSEQQRLWWRFEQGNFRIQVKSFPSTTTCLLPSWISADLMDCN